MATVSVLKQEKLFKLSDSEREEKVEQLLGVLGEIDHLKAEKKEYLAGFKDQMEDAERRLAHLREDLGQPESALSPQMKAARDSERSNY